MWDTTATRAPYAAGARRAVAACVVASLGVLGPGVAVASASTPTTPVTSGSLIASTGSAAPGDPALTSTVVVTSEDRTRSLITTATPTAAAALASTLRARGADASVQVHGNFLLGTPNDPAWPHEWGLGRIGAPGYWSVARGAGVVVAVVDTGVDATNPDLAGQVLPGVTILGGVTTSGAADDEGHGTHVAGIIGALTDNGAGIASVAPDVRILPVKVLDSTGSGDDSDIAAGIDYAVAHGADVINLSLGADVPLPSLVPSIDNAAAHHVLVVAAAGNDYARGNPVTYPAAYVHTLAVGATDIGDLHASFSETGAYVDLAAPGVNILSTYAGGGYAYMDGTSMAAPFVSAALAVLESEHPTWTPDEVAGTLEASATDLGAPGRDDVFGWGRIDLGRATATSTPLLPPVPTPADSPAPDANPPAPTPSASAPPAAPAGPVAAPTAPSPTALSIRAAGRVTWGRNAVVSGHLSTTGTALPGRTVDLYRSVAGRSWTLLASRTTDASGAVSFLVAPRTQTAYRLTFPGDQGDAASTSPVRTLRVTPRLSVGVTRVGARTSSLQGTCMSCAGAIVALQMRAGSRWVTVARTSVTGRNAFLLRRPAAGTAVSCRLVVSGAPGLTSASVSFRARLR